MVRCLGRKCSQTALFWSYVVFIMIIVMSAIPFLSIAPLTNTALGGLAACFTGLIIFSVMRLCREQQAMRRRQLQLTHEATALNEHAIVSMTDARMRIQYVNQKFTDATGYSAEDVMGRLPSDFYVEEDLAVPKIISGNLRRGLSWSGETRLRCKDGRIMHSQTTIHPLTDEWGIKLGAIAVRTDITEMRRAAAAIDTVAALRRLSEPVVMFMPGTLELVYMNKAATDAASWSGDEYLGKTVADIPLDLDLTILERKLQELSESELDQVVIRLERRGITFDASIQLITLQSGEQRYFAIFRNVSGELQLARARQEFIATVSHELRTPLTAIKGAMGLLLSGATGALPDKSRTFVEIAHRNADRLVLIVNDILDLEKIVAGKMQFRRELGDLAEVLAEAQVANQAFAEKFGVTVRLEGADIPALAEFDAARIVQVLTNLLSNACKFSPPGSEIVASIDLFDDNVRISVADSGIGIPAPDIAKLFERFHQASNVDRRNLGGSGLGLSIVKAIIEKHGGTISLTSTEGIGTTVSFTLPRAVDLALPKGLRIMAG